MVSRKAGVGDDGLRKTKGGVVMDKVAGAEPDTSIPIDFKNGTRRIDFKMGAIKAIEKQYPNRDTGNPTTPISAILRWQAGGFGMSWTQLQVFLWAGLLWETPNISLDEVEGMMDLKKIKYYSDQVDDALKLAFGITDEQIAEAQKAAEEGDTEAAQKNGILIGEN